MRDTKLYQHLLGLQTPWTVSRVELKPNEQRVDVWTEHAEGTKRPCPELGVELPGCDHAPERSGRPLDSCQLMTYPHARPRRVSCPSMERAAARGRSTKRGEPVRHMGIDERGVAKGHKYFTVVSKLEKGIVEHVADGREVESLNSHFVTLSAEQREQLEADIWDSYRGRIGLYPASVDASATH